MKETWKKGLYIDLWSRERWFPVDYQLVAKHHQLSLHQEGEKHTIDAWLESGNRSKCRTEYEVCIMHANASR
jgi:hypothetical protein